MLIRISSINFSETIIKRQNAKFNIIFILFFEYELYGCCGRFPLLAIRENGYYALAYRALYLLWKIPKIIGKSWKFWKTVSFANGVQLSKDMLHWNDAKEKESSHFSSESVVF